MRKVITVILLLASTCSLSSCTHQAVPAAATMKMLRAEDPIVVSPDESTRMGLSTSLASTREIPETLETAGVVKADTTMTMPVLSLVPGRADNVYVRIGDRVAAGQKLATIRSDEVAQIEGDMLEKLIELQSEELQLQVKEKLAEKTYNRKKLLLDEQIAAKADVEAAESDLQEADAALRSCEIKKQGALDTAKQRLRLFGISGDRVDRIAKTKTIDHIFDIYAPRAGILTEREVDPGEAVDTSKSLFTISDLRRVWIVAQVFEKNIAKISIGMPVEASISGMDNHKFSGKIDFIGDRVDPETRTVSVRATIANPDLKLKPEMFGQLALYTGKLQGVFVPEQAVQKLGEADILYVQVAPDTYEERKVEVGHRSEGDVQIITGVKPGERVVADGSVRLLGKVVQRINQ